jgi:hypothetical protein
MSEDRINTYQKALALNLDTARYGTIAEIGAGQEVARWFFTVGGASGTVAKTMSAYDMKVSDEVYGRCGRYVSRERLRAMLDHEYAQVVGRLAEERGTDTSFFAFADTISARNYHGTNICHGWIGIRFQTAPGREPNDLLLHLNLYDDTNLLQQQAVGVLGVNLIYAATRPSEPIEYLMNGLLDDLSLERIDVDYVEATGSDLRSLDPTRLNLRLIQAGLGRAILLLPEVGVEAPVDALYKCPVVVERGSIRRKNSAPHAEILERARLRLSEEFPDSKREPMALLEVSLNSLLGSKSTDDDAQLHWIEHLAQKSAGVMVTSFPENYLLAQYLKRYTNEPIRFAMGVSSLMQVFEEKYYSELDGGIVEALVRFLSQNVKLYILGMPAEEIRARLVASGSDPSLWEFPSEGMVTHHDVCPTTAVKHLFRYMVDTGALLIL